MIPAFIVPVYGRWDLTQRMLDSLDQPVQRGLLVDNARDVPMGLRLPTGFQVFTTPYVSMGWGGTMNFGITQMADAPWFMWCTNDVVVGPGDMAVLEEQILAAGDDPVVYTYRWAFGAMTRAVIQRIGLFDEWSYHPIYFEDTDFAYRCSLAGIPVMYDEWHLQEGEGDIEHSTTTRSNEALSMANNRTWELNQAAYVEKWGGLPGEERFTSPWASGLPLWAVMPSLDGRVARVWPAP